MNTNKTREPYFRQKDVPLETDGFKLKIGSWTFYCGAFDPSNPECIKLELPPTEIKFTPIAFRQSVSIRVAPDLAPMPPLLPKPSNYRINVSYLGEGTPPPPETPDSDLFGDYWGAPVLCTLEVPALGEGKALENLEFYEFDPGDVPDTKRDVTNEHGHRIAALPANPEPDSSKWERLDAQKHSCCFPCDLGQLEEGEAWFVEKHEKKEKK